MRRVNVEQVCFEPLPGKADQHSGWQIRRATGEKAVAYVCVSGGFLGVRVHYWQKRTLPHLRGDCEACAGGSDHRWRGYLLAIDHLTRERVLVEFPGGCAAVFDTASKTTGTLRGFRFTLSRAGKAINSRVICTARGYSTSPEDLPPGDDIWTVLCALWGIAPGGPTVEAAEGKGRLTQAEEAAETAKQPRRRNGVVKHPESIADVLANVHQRIGARSDE